MHVLTAALIGLLLTTPPHTIAPDCRPSGSLVRVPNLQEGSGVADRKSVV